MQRAAKSQAAPAAEATGDGGLLPELDDTLLEPEGADSDVFGDPDRVGELSARLVDEHAETPSGVIRTLESELLTAKPVSKDLQRVELARPSQRPSTHVTTSQEELAPSLKTQPINTRRAFRETPATVVRVHPAYDRIVQRLLTYRRTPRQGVILVTSAVAGEGTSTVARNVAMALSQAGTEQILLIDANLRTPSQHLAFHVERAVGFSEVLQGEVALASVIKDDLDFGISLMTSGSQVRSPSQVLKATALQGTIMALLSLYDWIILDAPPATVHPDVASLGTACGAAMLVIQAESTRSEVVDEAKSVLDGTGTDLLGAVLNRRRFHIPQSIYRRL
jgi:capsular exopolysaccharide synthesis family protein